MEENIFPSPEVLRVLVKGYVEVRLHTDKETEASKKVRQLQEERLNDVSMPIYEIVDPKNMERLGIFKGADLPFGRRFLKFLTDHAPRNK